MTGSRFRFIRTPEDPRKSSTVVGDARFPGVHRATSSQWLLVGPDSLYGTFSLGNHGSHRLEVALDTYPLGGESSTHYHPNKEHCLLVVKGRAVIWVGDEEREVGPMSWAWAPVDVPHGFRPANGAPVTMAIISSYLDANPEESGVIPASR